MHYLSAEEATRILRHGTVDLCMWCSENPNIEMVHVLDAHIKASPFKHDPYWMACAGFALGRATGIREEIARRKGA